MTRLMWHRLYIVWLILCFPGSWIDGSEAGGPQERHALEITVVTVADKGVLNVPPEIKGRDGGYSTRFRGLSVWVYGDTITGGEKGIGRRLYSNSWAWTRDDDASDGLGPFEHPTNPDGLHLSSPFLLDQIILADHFDAAAILAPTQSGRTAGHLSRFRPGQPIIAYTPNPTTMRRLSLFRGIYPRLIQNPNDTDDVIEIVAKRSIDAGDLSEGDLAIITAGQPVWVADMTNMIRVKRMPLTT